MKHFACLLFTLVLSFNLLLAQSPIKSGKVKSVTEVVIEMKGGKETEVKKSFLAFDERGNTIEEIEYDDDGKIKTHTTSEFNNLDQKVKETSFLADGKPETITLFVYNQEGDRVSKTVMNKEGAVKSKKIFRYEYR